MQYALAVVVTLVVVQAAALFMFGQPLLCECGYVKIWEPQVLGSGNSQHIFDWYTFSHIIHGFLFYLAAWFFFPRMSVWKRLCLAIAVEVGWEIIENTPWAIQHYREQALAQGYVGDTVLNSVFDTISAAIGFLMARRLPVWIIVVLAVGLEIFVGASIRDNLTLNVIGFFHQFEFISAWQMGG